MIAVSQMYKRKDTSQGGFLSENAWLPAFYLFSGYRKPVFYYARLISSRCAYQT